MMKRYLVFPSLLALTACAPVKPSVNVHTEALALAVPGPAPQTQIHQTPALQRSASQLSQRPKSAQRSALPFQVTTQTPSHIRGLYVSQATLQGPRLPRLLTFMRKHGLNTMVIDVKDDYGRITLTPAVQKTLKSLKQKHIYMIARIVVFKDPRLARRTPSLAIANRIGGPWTQRGVFWVDPFKPQVWAYNVRVAKRAVNAGYDEIQWDYVRFPDASKSALAKARFDNPKGLSKADDIAAFLHFARQNLQHVRISADVFGLVTSSRDDMGIGQVWEKMAPSVNVISPMMYPSHYGPGIYGLASPERNPHLTIENGLRDAIARNRRFAKTHSSVPGIRPWLQDFDMRVPYSRREVEHQIRAARELGIQDYLLWNQANRYS